jgi:integrase
MKAYVQSRDEKGKPTRWAVVVELGIIDGKRQRKYVYGKTRKEAEAKAAAAVGARQRGADLDKARTRLRDFLMDRWLPYQQPSLASHTYTSYKQICDLHINPDLGHLRLDELRVEHIDRLMAALRTRVNPRTKRRYADSFVVKIRAVLRAALGDAERWGFVGSNVAAKSEPVKLRKKRHKPPTDEQIRAILRAVEGHIYELVYHTLIKLGLRRGEALAIRWQDIDLDAGLVRITGSVQRQRAKGLVRRGGR